MKNYRAYGAEPYQVAVIHGGPGGAGDVKELAYELSASYSVLEPLQTTHTVQSQIEELKQYITHPINIIGYSWGAILSILVAAKYPAMVKKLILVGCPPLKPEYANLIMDRRLARLETSDREQLLKYIAQSSDNTTTPKTELFQKINELMDKSDFVDPIIDPASREIEERIDIYESVWPEAVQLRIDGTFIKAIQDIKSPITFIHGIYDPHPLEAIEDIIHTLKTPKLYVLENCGHTPWLERLAKEEFYEILKKEILI